MQKHTLSLLPQTYAICRLEPNGPIPFWTLLGDDFVSLTRTLQELSVICLQENVPAEIQAERDWHCFKVEGSFDLSVSGIHVSLAIPLAQAEISVLAIATYETDHILVKEADMDRMISVLEDAGHTIRRPA
jgi:hypothetical protein